MLDFASPFHQRLALFIHCKAVAPAEVLSRSSSLKTQCLGGMASAAPPEPQLLATSRLRLRWRLFRRAIASSTAGWLPYSKACNCVTLTSNFALRMHPGSRLPGNPDFPGPCPGGYLGKLAIEEDGSRGGLPSLAPAPLESESGGLRSLQLQSGLSLYRYQHQEPARLELDSAPAASNGASHTATLLMAVTATAILVSAKYECASQTGRYK